MICRFGVNLMKTSIGKGSHMRKLGLAVAIAASPLQSLPLHAAPSDTVVVCQLTSEKVYSARQPTLEEAEQKPRPIHEEFVLKFDDAAKRVTYIAGQAIEVKPETISDNNERFENEILFIGDSRVIHDGVHLRYSGEVSRLTGKIVLRSLYLNAVTGERSYAQPWIEKTGICAAGPRKF